MTEMEKNTKKIGTAALLTANGDCSHFTLRTNTGGLKMVVEFEKLKKRILQKRNKPHYIIEIDQDEEPQSITRELKPGKTTVFITARTIDEAQELYKASAARLHNK